MTDMFSGGAYAGESAAILDGAAMLAAHLTLWSARDDGEPDAAARRSANEAMDAIDRALRQLHALRERLADDMRASDDAAAARVDALLAGRRAARLATVTADEDGEHPGGAGQAAGSLPWVMSGDGTRWTAALPDGRTAVIERLGDGASFLPRIGDTAGPACAGLLGAAAWVAGHAGTAQ
jgi:hypothetical protein